MVTIVSNSTHLVAEYECNTGYVLIGDATRICDCNGQWSGSDVTCEGILEYKTPSHRALMDIAAFYE